MKINQIYYRSAVHRYSCKIHSLLLELRLARNAMVGLH